MDEQKPDPVEAFAKVWNDTFGALAESLKPVMDVLLSYGIELGVVKQRRRRKLWPPHTDLLMFKQYRRK